MQHTVIFNGKRKNAEIEIGRYRSIAGAISLLVLFGIAVFVRPGISPFDTPLGQKNRHTKPEVYSITSSARSSSESGMVKALDHTTFAKRLFGGRGNRN